ncbi:PD-(D/E)XK motif protein [Homoserinibacter sp. YIM 151385]|uniref:PD-(D/E)XK motif protein n=1 Tax=Homoserinibacter sp. YIM 151385 TaxID=2985506 RepID=UPI0022F01106|nr:PD-(D/E)XK motif protein [Homoserinibacter sp. YIM 151385]WBU39423.1 PD-(D/E)XK motif protein [Homoserinibacter sp. YIM 151385]
MAGAGYARVAHAFELIDERDVMIGEAAVAAIGPDRDLHEARLARDHSGLIHLMVRLPEGRERFTPPVGRVLPATWFRDGNGGATYLSVVSVDPALNPTFLSLIGEMLNRVEESGAACIDELVRVISAWREALEREQLGTSRSQLVGLFGELVVLERLAASDPDRALRAWRGKDGYRHDFFLDNAIEVKSYTGVDSPVAEVHGAYQLDPPAGGSLHLLAFRLEENAAGDSIKDIMRRLGDLGIALDAMLSRSSDAAPIVVDDNLRFLVAEERLYEVTERFPGLRASRLGADSLHAVSRIRYALLLDACPDRIDIENLPALLENL